MQQIYDEDNKSALERLGRQGTFKFRTLWSIRDGKGLNMAAKLKCSYTVHTAKHFKQWRQEI